MNQQVTNIIEVLEQAARGKVTLTAAQQQIQNINTEGGAATIKTQSLSLIGRAIKTQSNPANDSPAERLKAARRALQGLQESTLTLRQQAATVA